MTKEDWNLPKRASQAPWIPLFWSTIPWERSQRSMYKVKLIHYARIIYQKKTLDVYTFATWWITVLHIFTLTLSLNVCNVDLLTTSLHLFFFKSLRVFIFMAYRRCGQTRTDANQLQLVNISKLIVYKIFLLLIWYPVHMHVYSTPVAYNFKKRLTNLSPISYSVVDSIKKNIWIHKTSPSSKTSLMAISQDKWRH